MNKSDSIAKIAPALCKAQTAFTAAIKAAENPHFRKTYADLGSVIDAVKPHLNANGISFLQGVSGTERGVAVETMLVHDSGEWLSSTLEIPASKLDAQGYGSAITYGRRYGLQALCGVPAEDDDGNAATDGVRNEKEPVRHPEKSLSQEYKEVQDKKKKSSTPPATNGSGPTLAEQQREHEEKDIIKRAVAKCALTGTLAELEQVSDYVDTLVEQKKLSAAGREEISKAVRSAMNRVQEQAASPHNPENK